MRQKAPRPTLYSLRGSELSLSGPALLDIMGAVLGKGMTIRFRAKGWSMAPFIRDGDIICVSPLSGRPPRWGEVVAFVHPKSKRLVVHRVVATKAGHCLIQGDNMSGYADGAVPVANILGRVTRVDRDGRRVSLGLGPERFWIAMLSRAGFLLPVRLWLGRLRRTWRRRATANPPRPEEPLLKDGS